MYDFKKKILLFDNEIPPEEIEFNVSAGALIYQIKNKKIQILLSLKKDGNWYIPRGKREKKENLKETAIREVKEETGLKVSLLGKISIEKVFFWSKEKNKPIHKTIHYYLARYRGSHKIKIQDPNWIKTNWVSPSKAKILLKNSDYMKKVVDKGLKFIT